MYSVRKNKKSESYVAAKNTAHWTRYDLQEHGDEQQWSKKKVLKHSKMKCW